MEYFYKEYPRDSFDRFGDDLCELILSYLTIDRCFLLECLSKQIKNLIFKRQKKIIITTYNTSGMWLKYNDSYSPNVLHLKSRDSLDENTLGIILKKNFFIKDLYIDNTFKKNYFIYKTIINSCKTLKVFNLNFRISKELFSKNYDTLYETKLSNSIEILKFNKYCQPLKNLFTYFNNINAIYGLDTIDLSSFFDKNNKPVLLKLNTIELKIYLIESFKVFIAGYCNSIKILKLSIDNLFVQNDKIKENLINILSNLVNIKELEIEIVLLENIEELIFSNFESILNKCKKLKSFSIKCKKNNFKAKILVNFPKSKNLLEKIHLIGCESNIASIPSIIFENLNYLTLDMEELNETYLEDINIINLKNLNLINSKKITDKFFDNLTKFLNLQKFLFASYETEKMIIDKGFCDFFQNNQTLTNIVLNCNANISLSTINKFMLKAKNNSNRLFKFSYKKKFSISKDKIPKNFILRHYKNW